MKLVMSSLFIAVASSTLIAAAPAQADPAPPRVEAVSTERLELARRFMAVTDTTDVMEYTREMLLQSVAMWGDDLDDAGKASAEHRIKRYLALAEPKIRAAMPALLEANAQAYAREFSADELRQLIAFAQTPAGKHYIDRYDLLQMAPEVVDAQRELGAELGPVMKDLSKEMCAEKAAQRVAMGDTKAKCPLSDPETQAG
jgi:hypothetical protein